MSLMTDNDLTRGERLRRFRLAAGYSAERLAKVAKVSISTVLRHERDERGINPDQAKTYARLLRKTPSEILYGKQFNQDAVNTTINTLAGLAPTPVPLLSYRDVDQFRSIASGAIPMSDSVVFAPNNLNAGKRVTSVEVYDKSMECQSEESIKEGEHVFIDPDQPYAAGNIVAALAPGFDGVIFRKYRINSLAEDGQPIFDLIALNPDYPSVIGAHALGVTIVGRIVAVAAIRRI